MANDPVSSCRGLGQWAKVLARQSNGVIGCVSLTALADRKEP
jgi:hypothetical protein